MAVPETIAIAAAEWGECLVPDGPVPTAMRAEVTRVVGAVPGWLPRLARVPWVVRLLCDLTAHPLAYLDPDLADLVSLAVSQENSCRYCYGVQRAVLRIQGFRDDDIDRLLRDFNVGGLSGGQGAALDFARRVSRANPRPGRADFERLVQAGFGRAAAVEVAAIAASGNFANRLTTFVAMPSESLEQLVRRPLFRLVRPLMAWRMRAKRRTPEPPPPPREPCATVIAALGDSPTAGVVRRAVDGAFASDILPRRTKALMLAVVARALGCARTEEEARALLAREGLAGADVDDVLTNLRSPRLDVREERLVPFARETVRYQPGAIQARLRQVCRDASPEEIVETAAFAGLANALGRLSVVLDAC